MMVFILFFISFYVLAANFSNKHSKRKGNSSAIKKLMNGLPILSVRLIKPNRSFITSHEIKLEAFHLYNRINFYTIIGKYFNLPTTSGFGQKIPYFNKRIINGVFKLSFYFLFFTSVLFPQSSEWLVFTPLNSPLKTGFIEDITVDKFNNVWIATDSGLVKTDGINWTTYRALNGNSPGSRFFVVQDDKDGVIWAEANGVGLLRFDGISWSVFNTGNSPLPSNAIKSIVVDSSNNKWILSSSGYQNCHLTRFDGDSTWSNNIAYINHTRYGDLAAVDSVNNIWMADKDKLTKFDGNNYTFYPGNFGLYPTDIKIDLTGAIWVAGGLAGWGSLVRWKDGLSIVHTPIKAISIAIDRKNNIWVGSESKLYKFNGTSWITFNPTNSPIPNSVTISSLRFDKYENLWMVLTSDPYQLYGGVAVYRPSGVIIPVELSGLQLEKYQNSVSISWITSTETNNKGFDIERKKIGETVHKGSELWERVGFVEGRGTTIEFQFYSFVDKSIPIGKYKYRIKQVDYDGTFKYYDISDLIEIDCPVKFELSQNYPNPFNPVTRISWQSPVSSHQTLKVYDILGNKVATLVN